MILHCKLFSDRLLILEWGYINDAGKRDIKKRLNTLCTGMHYDDSGYTIEIYGDIGQIIYALSVKNTLLVV